MKRFWWVWILGLILLGCGGGENAGSTFGPQSASQAALQVSPVFRTTGLPVTKDIDPLGGSLEAFASDGTRYVLTFPAGALGVNTTITMTPAAVSGQLSLPVTLPYAVKIGPAGTQFNLPAVLAITLPSGLKAADYNPYLMDDSGFPMSLLLGTKVGQTITFNLSHLSTPGVSPDPVPNPRSNASPAEQFEAEIAWRLGNIALVDLQGGDSTSSRVELEQVAQNYFENILLPFLRATVATGTEPQCQQALRDALAFERVSQTVGLPLGADYQAQLQPLNVSLLNRGIDQSIAVAVTAQDWQKLKVIPETYMPWATYLGLDSEANNLTLAKIQARIPIVVEISQLDVPSDAVEGTPFQITAAAGYRLGVGSPVRTDVRLTAVIRVTGATPTGASGFINDPDSQPNFGTPFQLVQAGPPLAAEVDVDFDALPPFHFTSTRRVASTGVTGVYVARGTIYNGYGTGVFASSAPNLFVTGSPIEIYFGLNNNTLVVPPDPITFGIQRLSNSPFTSGLWWGVPSLNDYSRDNGAFETNGTIPVADQELNTSSLVSAGILNCRSTYTQNSLVTVTQDLRIPISVGGTVEGSNDVVYTNNPASNGSLGYRFTVTLTKLR